MGELDASLDSSSVLTSVIAEERPSKEPLSPVKIENDESPNVSKNLPIVSELIDENQEV